MTITTRQGKGAELSHTELDTNFTDLRDGVSARTPKAAADTGVWVGGEGDTSRGWHDLTGNLTIDPDDADRAMWRAWRGNIRQLQFATANAEAFCTFHIPHDYVVGSELYIHVHWDHDSTTLTGGSVTWGFECSYAKGFDQAAFSLPKTVTVLQNASTTQYQHMVAETALTTPGGSGTQLDTNDIEVDGVIICRMFLDSNDLTDSVTVPDPFAHFVDLHYQSTEAPTKKRAPDFYA